jgi:methyltransferase (TIGR00027 family)
MQNDKPSRTAAQVAALRGLGALLPPSARLVDDPWGAEWTGCGRLRRLAQAMPAAGQLVSRPAWRWLLYMQVRTFALDLEVVRFAQSGGRQLVLLGAGLDARALRLRSLGLRVFEVDHPATQARKRELVVDAATLMAWDFERDPLRLLPACLCDHGYRHEERGCVVWEGVSMYLSEAANEETFAMLADLLAEDSVVAFTYFGKALLHAQARRERLMRQAVARWGEPWRFGFDPESLASWTAARGFALEHNDTTATLAARWLPPDLAAKLKGDQRRIALARRCAPGRSGEGRPPPPASPGA